MPFDNGIYHMAGRRDAKTGDYGGEFANCADKASPRKHPNKPFAALGKVIG